MFWKITVRRQKLNALLATLVFTCTACGGGNGSQTDQNTPQSAANGGSTPASSKLFSSNTTITTSGNPNGVLLYNADTLFVALSNVPLAAGGTTAGVAVYARVNATFQLSRFVPLTDAGSSANGLAVTPDGSTLLVALEHTGLAFVRIDDLLSQSNNVTPSYLSQDTGVNPATRAGSFQVAVTPDGRYAFVANEYGYAYPNSPSGNVGVVSLTKGADGLVTGSVVGFIPLDGNTIPGVSISADGKRAYAVAEIVPAQFQNTLAGSDNPTLVSSNCIQNAPQNPKPNGGVFVIDISHAVDPANLNGILIKNSVVAKMAAACSPVRVAEAPNGSSLWVTARGSNEILHFDVGQLLSNPESAFVAAVPSGGQAPVGMAFLHEDNDILITNSNRFGTDVSPNINNENVAIFNMASGAGSMPVQILPTGLFPRDVSVSADDSTVAVSSYDSEVVTVFAK